MIFLKAKLCGTGEGRKTDAFGICYVPYGYVKVHFYIKRKEIFKENVSLLFDRVVITF